MNYSLDTLKHNIPSVSSSYGALDIVGQTFGRYFDYKKETAMIKHATKKLKYQTEIIIKNIDAELAKSLDSNNKNYKLEMRRLKNISGYIKSNNKNERELIKSITHLVSALSNPDIPQSTKDNIPQLITFAHQNLNTIADKNNLALSSMSSNSNTKQIEG